MITDNKLLIDRDCPMCVLYGKCFTKLNWVDNNTITPYQTIGAEDTQHIDMHKAKSMIALHNSKTRETLYGIDSILRILSSNLPLLGKVLNTKSIKALLAALYAFISYNRKVLVRPSKTKSGLDCTPELVPFYRWMHLIVVAIFTGYILTAFYRPIFLHFGWEVYPMIEYAICFGQVVFQYVTHRIFFKKEPLEYLGHMSTVSMIGALMLIPILGLTSVLNLSPIVMLIGFLAVVAYMLSEHILRSTRLGLGWTMTISWITFRTLVLISLVLFL
jgi:hypothetical protein